MMIKIKSFLLLMYVETLLKRKGFKYTCETIKKKKTRKVSINTSQENQILICLKINQVVNNNLFYPHAECLQRSLIGYYVLSQKGVDVDFCLGVSSDGNFASHAWLEFDGSVINDEKEFTEDFNKIMTF